MAGAVVDGKKIVDKIWLKQYPAGIPAEIDIGRYASVRDVFDETVTRFAPRPAFTCMGKSITFGELDRLSKAFAVYLQRIGCTKGTRVALMMPNILQYPVCLFGILRAGCTVVNVNPLYTARELEHQLADSGAEVIVVVENFASVLAEVIARSKVRQPIVTSIGELLGLKGVLVDFVLRHVKKMIKPYALPGAVRLSDALAEGRRRPVERRPLDHEDLAFLQYTGGTTGVAKGAMLTHGNIVANLQQVSAWVGGKLEEGREVVITALPMYHIYALTASCLANLKIGAHNVLITNPRDLPGFVKTLSRYRFSTMSGVNTLYNALLHTPGFEDLDFSSLKVSVGGGMAVQRAVAERWKKVTGKPLLEGYGLTETSPVACTSPLVEGAEFNGTAGLPVPSTTVTIRDDDGRILPLGETGEICIAGPQVMKGYWNRPDETAKVMTPDGAFRTGDIGLMTPEGYVKIVDRKKDMILVSGFNVYPNEVEDVIAMMPGVREVCAVPAPDEHSGEAVRVVIVRKDPSLTKEQVIEHCRRELTAYKVPHIVEFWDELPKTNVGKVLRREVRAAPARG